MSSNPPSFFEKRRLRKMEARRRELGYDAGEPLRNHAIGETHSELQVTQPDVLRAMRFRWLGYSISFGALVTSLWLIYNAYLARGVLGAIAAVGLMGLCYGPGPALMFAVASSFLCFYFGVVGLWLPLTSYVAGAIMLFVAARVSRALKD